MRVETDPLEAASAALLESGLDGVGGGSASWSMTLRDSNAPRFLGTAYDERTAGRRVCANEVCLNLQPRSHAVRMGNSLKRGCAIRSRGTKHPDGASLKLLAPVQRNGLNSIA